MGGYNIAYKVGHTLNCGFFDKTAPDEPSQLLAAEIVIHAVEDWRWLIKQEAWKHTRQDKYCNFDELRLFFNGEWCAFLLQDFDVQPSEILDMLEAELAAAMLQPPKQKKKRKG